jgi:uncharacterized protein
MQSQSLPLATVVLARPWYSQIWLWLLMLGPVTVILAGTYTGWLAFSQQDALVVDDYYKQGKAINQDLRRDRVAANLGLTCSMRYDAAAGVLTGRLLGKGGPIVGPVQIRLVHSTQPAKDIKLAVHLDNDGNFSVALPMLERTRWQVLVESGSRDWRLYGTWRWPQQHSTEIRAEPVR